MNMISGRYFLLTTCVIISSNLRQRILYNVNKHAKNEWHILQWYNSIMLCRDHSDWFIHVMCLSSILSLRLQLRVSLKSNPCDFASSPVIDKLDRGRINAMALKRTAEPRRDVPVNEMVVAASNPTLFSQKAQSNSLSSYQSSSSTFRDSGYHSSSSNLSSGGGQPFGRPSIGPHGSANKSQYVWGRFSGRETRVFLGWYYFASVVSRVSEAVESGFIVSLCCLWLCFKLICEVLSFRFIVWSFYPLFFVFKILAK